MGTRPITYKTLREIDALLQIPVRKDAGTDTWNYTIDGAIFHTIANQFEAMETENVRLKAKLYDLEHESS